MSRRARIVRNSRRRRMPTGVLKYTGRRPLTEADREELLNRWRPLSPKVPSWWQQ